MLSDVTSIHHRAEIEGQMQRDQASIHRVGLWFVTFGLIVVLSSHAASGATYVLDSKAKNRIEFHSKATLESFSGKSRNFSAQFEVDAAQLGRSTGTVKVDLRTLDTGIDLRNKHMRENHLHTDSFPEAIFVLDSVTGAGSLAGVGLTQITVHGKMTIHGVTKPLAVPASLTPADAGALRLQTEFPLKITDFGIPRPEFLFLKLAEDVRILVDLTISPSAR